MKTNFRELKRGALMLAVSASMAFAANAIDVKSYYSTPPFGSVIDLSNEEASVCIGFNAEVNYEKAVVIAPNGTEAEVPSEFNVTQYYSKHTDISSELKATLAGWLADGTIKGGESFGLKFVGIEPAVDGDTMSDEIKNKVYSYIASGITTTKFVSGPSNDKIFYSYYMSNDADGVLVYEFDGALLDSPTDKPFATLDYGTFDGAGNQCYSESLPVTVEGNCVKVDLRGKSRRVEEMVTDGSKYPNIRVTMGNVKDAEGSPLQSGRVGGPYSWQNSFTYQEVPLCNVIADITPANGGTLAGVDNMEIWFDNYSKFYFTGVKFAYTDGGVEKEVIVTDYTKEVEGDEVTMTVPVPAEVKGKPVTVSLANLECKDGADYSRLLMASYDKFTILKSTPAYGTVLAKLDTDQKVTVTTNMDSSVAVMAFVMTDLNPDDPDEAIMRYSYFQKNTEGAGFVYNNPRALILYKGHKYEIKAIAYADEAESVELGSDAIVISGDTKPFEYSPVQFVSITPDTDIDNPGVLTDASQREFVLKFDGLVKLDSRTSINIGYGMSQSFESISIVEGDDVYSDSGYSDTWKLTVSESFMQSCGASLTFSVFPVDMDGMIVEGNTGKKETSYWMFVYQCNFNAEEMAITPADGAQVTELSSFEFTFPKGVGISDAWSGQAIELRDESGALVASGSEVEEVSEDPDDFFALPVKCIVALDKTVTAEGKYTLHVPAQMFVLQVNDYDYADSPEMTVNYEIVGTSGIETVNAATAEGKSIYNLQGVKLSKVAAPGLYIIDGKKVMVK